MHKEVEKIIDRLVGAVKSDKPFYTLQELLSAGFPAFIVERIRIEINEKIKNEITMPETYWVDMTSKLVQEEWLEFRNSLLSNSRIPQAEFYDLVKSVVNEIVKVYLEPRRYMADYIYKGEDSLDYADIIERTNRLTIYKHFGKAIPLYMQKRKLRSLEKKRCKLLIQNLDARLVASYSAEDWAKVLELLFRLFGGSVDAKLLQLFFEDKSLYLTAKALNAIEGSMNKERFIEVLSYPDLLDVQLQEKFKEQFREVLIEQKNRFDTPIEDDDEELIDEKEQALLDNFFGSYDYAVPPDEQESLNALFKAEGDYQSIFDDFEEPQDTEDIHDAFKGDLEKRGEEMQRFRANLMDVLDEAVSSFKKLSEEEQEEAKAKPKKKPSAKGKKSTEADSSEKPSEEDTDPKTKKTTASGKKDKNGEKESRPSIEVSKEQDEDERPMWQQFLSDDHMQIIMGNGSHEGEEVEEHEEGGGFIAGEDHLDEEDGIVVEDDFVGDNILDSFQREEDEENASDDEQEDTPVKRSAKAGASDDKSLKELMEPYKEYLSDEIFNGSKRAFNTAVKELDKQQNWKGASGVLNKKIFAKHNVDITSEAAVELTDLLQSYFRKKE